MTKNITLTLTSCLESLPTLLDNRYNTSEMLLAKTVYNNLVTCYFYRDINGIGYFQPGSESRPYSIKEITHWSSLGELMDEQHDGDKL